MSITTINKNLRLNNTSINERISKWIEQDIIVPDTKPDAIKVINVNVVPYVNDIEAMQDKIKISGVVNYFVIYKVDDEVFANRGLFSSYNYSEILDLKGSNKDMVISIKPECKNIIYSLPNERKISIKSELIFKTNLRKIEDVKLINKFESDKEIECKMCKNTFCNIIQDKKNIIASKEDFILPKEAEDFYELLNVESRIINTEYKESYNKIMIKGDMEIKMLYLTENKEDSIKSAKQILPFSAMVELENINEKSKFDIEYIIQEFNLNLNPDITSTKTMSAEYRIEVSVTMYEEEETEYIEDFYSQTKELDFSLSNLNGVKNILKQNKIINIKENISNILLENMKILDYKLDKNNINIINQNNVVKLEGEVKVSLLIQDISSFEISTKQIEIIVDESFEIDWKNNANICVDILNDKINIIQNGVDIEVRIELEVCTKIEEIESINIIDNIVEENLNLDNLDSINIYIVKQNDTLWDIAKRYKTSMEKILKTNNLENYEDIEVGQKILVIR